MRLYDFCCFPSIKHCMLPLSYAQAAAITFIFYRHPMSNSDAVNGGLIVPMYGRVDDLAGRSW